jgi:hypothetical protein
VWRNLTLAAIAVLFVGLVGHRVWRYSQPPAPADSSQMPAQVGEAEQRELHLTPGGKYTSADIEANNRQLPSEKFRSFQARHEFNPKPGDRLCPVTRTKANPRCVWTIGGREYQFCCPPCIDEFVRLAKERPEEILPPEAYDL